jgi:predicted outer membrane repeat protein
LYSRIWSKFSADTLVQNLLTDPTRADNSYHVVYSNLCGSPTLLDGLIITDGQANGAGVLGNGGGWYNITSSSPTITNCTFTRNAATTRGGAWYNEGANCKPSLTTVTFTKNYTANRGGAVAMLNTGADAKLNGCQFSQNRAATHGGSIYLDRSSPTILVSAFSNDYAANGGSLAGIDNSVPTITNTTFTNGSATTGGVVWAESCQAKFYDSSFIANSATSGGACYFNAGHDCTPFLGPL